MKVLLFVDQHVGRNLNIFDLYTYDLFFIFYIHFEHIMMCESLECFNFC